MRGVSWVFIEGYAAAELRCGELDGKLTKLTHGFYPMVAMFANIAGSEFPAKTSANLRFVMMDCAKDGEIVGVVVRRVFVDVVDL
jgi:hypothetical protein